MWLLNYNEMFFFNYQDLDETSNTLSFFIMLLMLLPLYLPVTMPCTNPSIRNDKIQSIQSNLLNQQQAMCFFANKCMSQRNDNIMQLEYSNKHYISYKEFIESDGN